MASYLFILIMLRDRFVLITFVNNFESILFGKGHDIRNNNKYFFLFVALNVLFLHNHIHRALELESNYVCAHWKYSKLIFFFTSNLFFFVWNITHK